MNPLRVSVVIAEWVPKRAVAPRISPEAVTDVTEIADGSRALSSVPLETLVALRVVSDAPEPENDVAVSAPTKVAVAAPELTVKTAVPAELATIKFPFPVANEA